MKVYFVSMIFGGIVRIFYHFKAIVCSFVDIYWDLKWGGALAVLRGGTAPWPPHGDGTCPKFVFFIKIRLMKSINFITFFTFCRKLYFR